ncbi:MAG TPA: biopolymer transporter ExbD [Longimicrobiaceae bacterium]|nr:biopolymer transporter ExbD [Longimicrobiaceae bacterium]
MSMKTGGGASFGGSAIPTIAGLEGQDVNGEINVTPMIDVMLVLLIIFMVVTPALSYTAILPKAVNVAPQADDRVTLGIDTQGLYYINKNSNPVAPADLTAALQQEYNNRPGDHVLYLKADQGVPYSVVLTAIDDARRAGVAVIGAITELPKGATENQ